MIQSNLYKKSIIAFSVVLLASTVGIFSAQALAKDNHGDDNDHYTKDQCKNGGWKNFKNPDGSMKFKNQGQCIAFFNHQDENDQDHNHQGDNDDKHKGDNNSQGNKD